MMRMLKTALCHTTRRFAAFLMCFVLAAALLLPVTAHARETGKTVRVGWYESPFNTMDDAGRRSGYAYEYQQKIASYTGWTYEYVDRSWPELLQMLIDGEIDLLSDVSVTPARTEQMLFPNLAMGAEEYYIFVNPGNTEIRQDDPHTLNGKKIGVNRGSVQAGFYHDWAKHYGVQAELVELVGSEVEAMQMMQDGELDAYLTLDAYGGFDNAVPMFKVGSSDFFFAVNKDRPDLLEELNIAMNRIQEENRYFSQQLAQKYISTSGANLYLNFNEQKWLSGRGGVIRIGYQDDFLAFCAADKATGELTGALKEYLDRAAVCFKNSPITFKPVAYPTAGAAIEALRNREIDCMFPSNLSTADGEAFEIIMTPAMMSTDIYAIVRKSDRDSFMEKKQVTVAVEENDPNYVAVILDHFHDWKSEKYPNMQESLKAVSDGKADCVLISNYQYNSLARLCEKYGLSVLATGEDIDFFIAVNLGDNELYSILARTTNLVSRTSINTALSYYSSEDARTSVLDFIRDNPAIDVAVIVIILALLLVIAAQQRVIRAKREVEEKNQQVDALNRQVFVDALTHVRNRGGYEDYIRQLQSRLDQGEVLEMAIGVFDCDNLKGINDQYGHDKGNLYLQASCSLIYRVFRHSPVFRIGGDEFVVILQGEDYENRETLLRRFEEKQTAISACAKNEWEKVSVSFGLAVYDPLMDLSLKDLARRADQLMYENKHTRKDGQNGLG